MSESSQKSEFLQIANWIGSVSVESEVPTGLDHVQGARLQPLCRKLGIQYANAITGWDGGRFGSKPLHDGVVVMAECATRLRNALVEREQRSAVRYEREKRKQEQEDQKQEVERAERLEQKRASFRERFPRVSDVVLEQHINGKQIFETVEEIPFNILSGQEIEDLHLTPLSECALLLTDAGATAVPLYTATLPPDELNGTADEEVHRRAVDIGYTPQKALWTLNKLVKIADYCKRKRDVYSLKDKLLVLWSQYLVEGRVARIETKLCWSCDGEEGYCNNCGGGGIYSSSTLYEVRYKFPDDERSYVYHTYRTPASVSDEPGADKGSYGGRFSSDDRKQMPFGFHDLMRIVRHEITLLEQAANERERMNTLNQWSQFGLPPVKPNANTPDIRKCLKLIEQLTSS